MEDGLAIAVQNGLVCGVVVAVYFSVGLLLLNWLNPLMLLNDYPPDIQKRYRELNPDAETQRRKGTWAIIPFYIGLIVVFVFSVLRLQSLIGTLSFLTVAVSLCASMLVSNAVDLLVLDWLMINIITPKFVVLPGTEGMAGYKNYRFHFRGFLIGCLVSIAIGLIGGIVFVILDLVF